MQVRFRRGSFGQTGERGPFGIVGRGGLSCVVGRRLGELHVQQHIGELVLDGLERAYCPPELHPQLRITYRRVEHGLGAAHHLVGKRDRRPIESAEDWRRTIIEVAEQVRMSAAKIDARDLAGRIHRFQKASFHAGGIRIEREQRQPLEAGSLRGACGDDQQVRHVAVHDETFDSVETVAVRIGSGDKLDAGWIPIAIGLGDRQRRQARPFCDLGQQGGFLRLGASAQNRIGSEHGRREIRSAKQCAAKLLRNDAKLHHAKPCATILLRYVDAGQRQILAQLAPHRGIVTLGSRHQAPNLGGRRFVV